MKHPVRELGSVLISHCVNKMLLLFILEHSAILYTLLAFTMARTGNVCFQCI